MIKSIDKDSVHFLQSDQVITDISTVVKEIVENSLDAEAKFIEIFLGESGLSKISVSDDGTGIAEDDFTNLALKHRTSKLQNFGDLRKVGTLGFRGEALSSLCSLGRVTVETATEGQEIGNRLKFDGLGTLVSQGPVARKRGTTVCVEDIFARVPVRRQELKRNKPREFAKLVRTLISYALISFGVRFRVTDSRKGVVLKCDDSCVLRERYTQLFGTKGSTNLSTFRSDSTVSPKDTNFSFNGLVSPPDEGRSSKDRQFLYIAGRPVDLPGIARVIAETYRSFAPKKYPAIVVDIRLPPDAYDVNVTPSKRTVLLHQEKHVATALKQAMEAAYATQNVAVRDVAPAVAKAAAPASRSPVTHQAGGDARIDKPTTAAPRATGVVLSVPPFHVAPSNQPQALASFAASWCRDAAAAAPLRKTVLGSRDLSGFLAGFRRKKRPGEEPTMATQAGPSEVAATVPSEPAVQVVEQAPRTSMQDSQESGLYDAVWTNEAPASAHSATFEDTISDTQARFGSIDDGVSMQDKTASELQLTRTLERQSFAEMDVIGQFNKGFIIARFRGDLYIIDQHAADEIYTFHTLQAKELAKNDRQTLVRPVQLMLSAGDEEVLRSNIGVFSRLGFRFQIEPSNCAGQRYLLKSIPTVMGKELGVEDVEELLFKLNEGISGVALGVLPTKIRDMFASRACRSSVMVGTTLDRKAMERIVRNLGTIDRPWNCPHGRPTIRHLCKMADLS